MKFPNKQEVRVPTGHQDDSSGTGGGLHLIELLAKCVPQESPNKPVSLLQSLRVAFHKLTARSHCLKQYPHNSLDREMPSCCLHKTFTL